jgi:hypothetical protein
VWGTTSLCAKLTSDFGSAPEGIANSDYCLLRLLAGNLSFVILGLLQHYRIESGQTDLLRPHLMAHAAEGFPPPSTVQGYFYLWRDESTRRAINYGLVMEARDCLGRDASPNAGIIDSQGVKTMESAGPRGFNAGTLVKGRKRHILTDTGGLLVAGIVHKASIQDRDGAVPLIASMRGLCPWRRHLVADTG